MQSSEKSQDCGRNGNDRTKFKGDTLAVKQKLTLSSIKSSRFILDSHWKFAENTYLVHEPMQM